jgi:glycosyltransferase involved in cell wall biosynthesis
MRKATTVDRRLRVLVYTSLFPNSVQPILGNFVMERIRALRQLADVTVVAPVPYFPRLRLYRRWSEFARIPRRERIREFDLDHPRYLVIPKIGMVMQGLSMFLGSARQVMKKNGAGEFDVIDAHYVYPDGFAAVLLGRLLDKPVVVSARGSDINVFPKFRTIRPLIRYVLKHADAVIAVSQGLKDRMLELGCPDGKVSVIANGVDCTKFQPRPQLQVRNELGLPHDRKIILSVGKLTSNKGFHILMEAVARLGARRPDVMLVIIGEGPDRAGLERRIRDLGLRETIRMAGARPHEALCSWYSAADVFCLASATEGWPNVVMEAMACGVPVVCTPVAAPIIGSARIGIVTSREPQALEQALDQALSRKWNRDEIAGHVRSSGWDRVGESVLDVLTGAVARRARSRVAGIVTQAGQWL